MAAYPTEPVAHVTMLDGSSRLGPRGDAAVATLATVGLRAATGLDEPTRAAMAAAATEPHIVEFCPNDAKRFADPAAGRSWMAKGRGLVTIVDGDGTLLAYGWSGVEHNAHVPGADVTTAYRVTAAGQTAARRARTVDPSFRLGIVLGDLVVATAVHVWGAPAEQISLETWGSNTVARRLYADLGFEQRAESPDERPTLQPIGSLVAGAVVRADPDRPGRHLVDDARCFYVLTAPA